MSKALIAPQPTASPRRQSGTRGLRHAVLLAITVGLAGMLGSGLAGAQGGASTPVSAVSAAQPDTLALQMDKIERLVRARPMELDAPLLALQARTAAGSIERVNVLSLRGMAAAHAHDRSLVDAVGAQLELWPNPATAPAAALAHAFVQATYLRVQGDMRSAIKALAVIDEPRYKDVPGLIMLRARSLMALLRSNVGNVDAAITNALQAVRLAEASGQGWRQATTLNDLANVYKIAEQTDRARLTHEQALREAELDPDPMLMNDLMTVRGMLHANDADISIALQSFNQALEYAAAAGADSVRAQGLANLADIYLRQAKYARAQQLAEEALPLARRTRNLNAEIIARNNMGLAKIAQNRVAEGRADTRAAILLDEQQGAFGFAAEGWQELGDYLERAGDYSGAIAAHHEYRRLIDQALRDDTRKAVLEAQERYDAEQRGKEIELLNRDNHLLAEQIRAGDLELQLWASLAGCVVLSAALMGMAYRRIRKTNQALASSNEKLKVQSERDPLTGLANRRHFQSVIKSQADQGRLSGTVFLIDIDHFKRINDQHGHAAGDNVLIEVARRLSSALREDDLVVRWGGEEFLITVKSRDRALAQQLAQRLLDLISSTSITHNSKTAPVHVTASIGFATFPMPPHGLSLGWERAIDLVDTVMYMAKAHGRNRAYGIEHIQAADEAALVLMANRLEAAWHEGQVGLVSLHGVSAFSESRL
ncbi:hypothetical protein BH11PSE10_BH11PSE10_14640 [soil metagenome]